MNEKPESQPEQNTAEEKKLYVDEDWKAHVEAEKEALKHQEASPKAGQAAPEAEPPGPLPPPSLVDLASSLAMQSMIALGLVANPLTGKAEVRLHHARHLIDMIAMLREKTEGNRTAEETAALDQLLHELRLGFLGVQGKPLAQPG